jgi:hypothetical protein
MMPGGIKFHPDTVAYNHLRDVQDIRLSVESLQSSKDDHDSQRGAIQGHQAGEDKH